jgi:hypothetical protein
MLDDETGLFVLQGSLENFDLPANTLSILQGERKLAEFNSQVPFRDNKGYGPMFLNKTTGWFRNPKLRQQFIDLMVGDKGAKITDLDVSMYDAHHTHKIAERRFVNEFSGVAGNLHRLKVILRQQGVGTKRVILFYTGVPPEVGGRTWVVSPHGFPLKEIPKYVAVECEDIFGIPYVRNPKQFLWFAITNAMPFVSNSRLRARDEPEPRMLYHNVADLNHHNKIVEQYLDRVTIGDFPVAADILKEILADGKPIPPKAAKFKTDLSVDVDDSLFCLQGSLHGKV